MRVCCMYVAEQSLNGGRTFVSILILLLSLSASLRWCDVWGVSPSRGCCDLGRCRACLLSTTCYGPVSEIIKARAPKCREVTAAKATTTAAASLIVTTRQRGKAQHVANPACANSYVHFLHTYRLTLLEPLGE